MADDKPPAVPPPEETGGKIERDIKFIKGKVGEIDGRLSTYEEITGAGEEVERRREEDARCQLEEELKKKAPEEKPAVPEKPKKDEDDLLDIWN